MEISFLDGIWVFSVSSVFVAIRLPSVMLVWPPVSLHFDSGPRSIADLGPG